MTRLVLLLACVGLASAGCGSRGRNDAALEAKVLARLGDSAVETVSVTASGADAESVQNAGAALKELRARGKTVAEKVKACREIPGGVPAELTLVPGIPVADIQKEFGPFQSESKRPFLARKKDIVFYGYGNLEVGIDEGHVVVVSVR